MILNIKQTQFGAEPEFEIEDTATGETLAKCTSLNHISTEIVFAGQNAYTLSFEPVLQEREGEKNELMYSILEHNRPVGGLYTAEVCQKKILFVSVGDMTIIKYSFTIESISCMKSDWERTGIIFVYIRTDRRWRLCISRQK